MSLPHITSSLSGPTRLLLGVSATCFTSRLGIHTSKQPLPIDLFHFLPYSHSMLEKAGTHGPQLLLQETSEIPHQRYGLMSSTCASLSMVLYVATSVLLSDTQPLK